jgi:uncharacterized membrane protein
MDKTAVSNGDFNNKLNRIESIDFVRGLVMIIMALDHTRDFMHIGSISQDPLNLMTSTPLLFFTRWITHFCAPVFVFLAGTSAFISMKRRNNLEYTRRYLITRGIWLIIIEFTLINFAIWFDLHFRILLFEVIAAIGFGFIILSLLLKLPVWFIGLIGLLIIFGHNFLSGLEFENHPVLKQVLTPLINFNLYQVSPRFTFIISYPFIPWFGIMLTGYATGRLFELPAERRKKIFLSIGLSALILFVLLRFLNYYGDQSRWSVQKNELFTFLSFINVSKYPPSLLFSLMTLGVMFLIFHRADDLNKGFKRIVGVYGRVPFFYFLLHLYIIHCLMIIIMLLQGYHWADLSFEPFQYGRAGPDSGIKLPAIYLVWLSVVVILYPLCHWYGNYKTAHKENKFLRYL